MRNIKQAWILIIFCSVILLSPAFYQPAYAAVPTQVGIVATANDEGVKTLTVATTVPAGANLLIAIIFQDDGVDPGEIQPTLNTVTYGGVDMTPVTEDNNAGGTANLNLEF